MRAAWDLFISTRKSHCLGTVFKTLRPSVFWWLFLVLGFFQGFSPSCGLIFFVYLFCFVNWGNDMSLLILQSKTRQPLSKEDLVAVLVFILQSVAWLGQVPLQKCHSKTDPTIYAHVWIGMHFQGNWYFIILGSENSALKPKAFFKKRELSGFLLKKVKLSILWCYELPFSCHVWDFHPPP